MNKTPKRPRPVNIRNLPVAQPEKNPDERYIALESEIARLKESNKKLVRERDIQVSMYTPTRGPTAPDLPAPILRQQLNDALREKERLKEEIERATERFKESLSEKDYEIAKLHYEIADLRKNMNTLRVDIEKQDKADSANKKKIFDLRERQEKNRAERATLERKLNSVIEEKAEERQKNPFSSLVSWERKHVRILLALLGLEEVAGEKDVSMLLQGMYKECAENEEYSLRNEMTPEETMYILNRIKCTKKGVEHLKSFLKHLGINDPFASRTAMDKLEKEMLESSSIDVYTAADGTVVGKVRNVKEQIESRLTDLAATNKLIFDKVTGQDIHIAFFGDKGGTTTKLVAVIVNMLNPNSRYHIVPLGIFSKEDTAENMREYIGDVIDQINELAYLDYKENGGIVRRNVVQMLGGDLKFLSSCFGHEGGNCSHLCLLCHGKNGSHITLRNIEDLEKKHRTLIDYLKDSKNGNNSITSGSKILFKRVHFSKIIPPSLHIIMGIANRYFFVYLMNLAAKLDNPTSQLVDKLSKKKSHLKQMTSLISHKKVEINETQKEQERLLKIRNAVQNFIDKKVEFQRNAPPKCSAEHCFYEDKNLKVTKKERLDIGRYECQGCEQYFHGVCSGVFTNEDKEDLQDPNNIHQCLSCLRWNLAKTKKELQRVINETDSHLNCLENDCNVLINEKSQLEYWVYGGNGPFRKALEECWRENGADISTWTQTFTGNQTYTLLQEKAIDEMFAIFPPSITHEHLKKSAKHLGVIQSLCTPTIYNKDEHIRFKEALKGFLDELKLANPNDSVTPKLHWLATHVLPFVKLHHSWARVCEQGIESMHAYVNGLMRHYASTRSKELQMTRVFKKLLLNNKLSDKFDF